MKRLKHILFAAFVLVLAMSCGSKNQEQKQDNMNQELTLTQEWDKKFPKSDLVEHTKITFHNRYGIT